METQTNFKVGDYVTVQPVTGIVYESHEAGIFGPALLRIQKADGSKMKFIPTEVVQAATAKEVEAFEKEAVDGITPEAIIEREKVEHPAWFSETDAGF